MLDQVLNAFQLKPDFYLDLMREDQSLSDLTARGMTLLQRILAEEQPDVVLVQGDTTTALVGSLAAYYSRIPVGHIEAGLRTQDKYAPFPEEGNRRIVDVLSDILFAPTEAARGNLVREGHPTERIFVTGNTVVDSLLWFRGLQSSPAASAALERRLWETHGITLAASRKVVLVTGHRRESFGQAIESICCGLRLIAERNRDLLIVYPVHLNPHVRGPVIRSLGSVPNVVLTPPLDYELFTFLMAHSYLILTDSGGIQEEAPTLGIPVLVMRDTTERPEAVAAGVAKLVGTNAIQIADEAQLLLSSQEAYSAMRCCANPFGDGRAAERVVRILTEWGMSSVV